MGQFMMGTHQPSWLTDPTWPTPLFISRSRLAGRKTLPRAAVDWALDSGGFTELKNHGRWRITPEQYVDEVRRYATEIGRMRWAAPMDWMCEPWVITGGSHDGQEFVGTGLSVVEHQRRTVDNYLRLRELAPDLPFIPVLQGWQLRDYLRCLQMYADAGIDLTEADLVGLGSVCRRQATDEIAQIAATLADLGLRLHGFGVKKAGIGLYGGDLSSLDSLAWSSRGRRVAGCGASHKSEANCRHFARRWVRQLLDANPYQQPSLYAAEPGGTFLHLLEEAPVPA